MNDRKNKPISTEIQALLAELHSAREKMLKSTVLDKLEKGELSRDAWVIFAVQRYLAATHFEKLLVAGLSKAEIGSLLAKTLQANLDDETGRMADGTYDEEYSHTKWRKDFYSVIGVTDEIIQNTLPLEGTELYSKELEKLAQDDVLKIAGALLVLEFTIPNEFKKIQSGRDKTFAKEFVEAPDDSQEIKKQKAKSRLYIDDHIVHDARSHYPDLLRAVGSYLSSEINFLLIKEGIIQIANAKEMFYQSLDKKLM